MYLQKIIKKLVESDISEEKLLQELKTVIKEYEEVLKPTENDFGDFLLQNLNDEELTDHLKNMKKLTILFDFTFPEHDYIEARMEIILGDEDSDDYNPEELAQLTIEESEEIKELAYEYFKNEFKEMVSTSDEIRIALF